MTKSIKPGALQIDWGHIHDRFREIDNQRSVGELEPAWQRGEIEEPCWAKEYLPALQRALEGSDERMLLEVLDARRLAHPQLMPLFAELLRRKAQGLSGGAGSKLTEVQKRSMHRRFQHVPRGSRTAWKQRLADALDVSTRTIEKAIAEIERRNR